MSAGLASASLLQYPYTAEDADGNTLLVWREAPPNQVETGAAQILRIHANGWRMVCGGATGRFYGQQQLRPETTDVFV